MLPRVNTVARGYFFDGRAVSVEGDDEAASVGMSAGSPSSLLAGTLNSAAALSIAMTRRNVLIKYGEVALRETPGSFTAQPPVNLAVHVTAMQIWTETGGLIMQCDVRGAIAALFSIVPTIFVTGCLAASSKATATGSSPVIANNPYPDLPANYRKQIADYMQTQRVALGLLPLVIHQGEQLVRRMAPRRHQVRRPY